MKTSTAGYYRAKNNHVFVQLNIEHLGIIQDIINKRNQRIHIFEIYPMAAQNLIRAVIDIVDGKAKLVFHISSMLSDYAAVIRDWNKDLNKPYKITIDGARVEFSMTDYQPSNREIYSEMYKLLIVKYGKDRYCYQISAVVSTLYETKLLPVPQYQSSGIFNTTPKQRYPELFKDTIIKQFKKSCPNTILESFNSNDDIWEYIMENYNRSDSSDTDNSNIEEDEY